jgi:hypothetical protein
MKQPNPDKFVVIEGIPITVHSAGVYPLKHQLKSE